MRVVASLCLCMLAAIVLSGCHDEQRLRERLRGPRAVQPMRLPVEPDQPTTPPAPALLDTVLPWQQPRTFDTTGWQLVCLRDGDAWTLRYLVPLEWVGAEGEEQCTADAHSRSGLIESVVVVTPLRDEDISLATYAAQLAEGSPIYQYATLDGHTVYVTTREVSVAPSDRNAPRQVFHTAVVDVDGHIAKLDVRYDTSVDWRFAELADAVTGTLEVHRAT